MDQVSLARIWGGIHFRYACEAAVQEGAEIADYVKDNIAMPVHGASR